MAYQDVVMADGATVYLPLDDGRLGGDWTGGSYPQALSGSYTLEAWIRGRATGDHTVAVPPTVIGTANLPVNEPTTGTRLPGFEPHFTHWVTRERNGRVGFRKQGGGGESLLLCTGVPALANTVRTYVGEFDFDAPGISYPHHGIVIGYLDDSNYDAVYIRATEGSAVWWRMRSGSVTSTVITNTGLFSGASLQDSRTHTLSVTLNSANTVTALAVDGVMLPLTNNSVTTPWGNKVGFWQHDSLEGRGAAYSLTAPGHPGYEMSTEDFEGLPRLNWSNPAWTTQSAYKRSGTSAMRSPPVNHSSSTANECQVSYAEAGEFSFWYMVESEANCDFFRLTIDGVVVLAQSGITGWQQFTTTLQPGAHTVSFSFQTDGSVFTGISGVVIDDIRGVMPKQAALLGPLAPQGRDGWKAGAATWSGTVWADETWRHVALVVDAAAGTTALFVDGESLGTRTGVPSPRDALQFGLGLNIDIDDVSYAPVAISSGQLKIHAAGRSLPIEPPRWYGRAGVLPELEPYLRRALPGEAKVHGLPEGWSVLAGGVRYTRDTTGTVSVPPGGRAYILDADRALVAVTGPLLDRAQYGLIEEGELTESETLGYGYYGNYGSGFFGGVPDVEQLGSDVILLDESSENMRGREFVVRDTVGMTYGRISRYGEIFKEALDTLYVSDNALPRGGRFFKFGDDAIQYSERLRQSGIRAYVQSDTAGLDDSRPVSRVGLAAKTTTQIYQVLEYPVLDVASRKRAEAYALTESWSVSGVRLRPVTDEIRVHDQAVSVGGFTAYSASDSARLTESTSLHYTRRSLTVTDNLLVVDTGKQGGIREFLTRESFGLDVQTWMNGRMRQGGTDSASLTDRSLELHGKLYPNGGTETVGVELDFVSIHGKRRRYGTEEVWLYDLRINPNPEGQDTFSVEDSGDQGGIRAFYAQDNVGLSVRHQSSHPLRAESFWVEDRAVFPYLFPLARENVTLGESGGVFGLGADLTTLDDSVGALQRHKNAVRGETFTLGEVPTRRGRVQLLARESVGFLERFVPFRLDWTETIRVTDSGDVEERGYRPIRTESVRITERGSLGGFLVQPEDAETYAVQDSGVVHRLGQRDSVRVTDSGVRRGTWHIVRRDGVEGVTWHSPPQNHTPHLPDTFTLVSTALQLHGKLRLKDDDSATSELTALQLHGRRRMFAADYVQLTVTRNTPAVPRQSETFTLFDGQHNMPAGVDWSVLRDSGHKEDTVQVVRMQDRGILNTQTKKGPEYTRVLDTGWVNTTLSPWETYRLRETRLVLRGMHGSDAVSLVEKGKLFRKSDYLEPDPDFYSPRPGRTRTALRTVLGPDGALWAVWLSKGTVKYTRRVYADSWRQHALQSVTLPFGTGVSCTLIFEDGEPVPVVEHAERVHLHHDGEWVALPGVDPVNVAGALAYLSPDRLTLYVGAEPPVALPTTSRITQAFSGTQPGALVLNDLDEVTHALGQAPERRPEPEEEVASVRWAVPQRFPDPVAYLAPIEGTVTQS